MSNSRERLKKNTRKQRVPKLLVQLQKKAELLASILQSECLTVSAKASDFAKEFFERSPLNYQRRVIRELDLYIKVLQEFKNSGADLWDSPKLTWAYLKARQLQPSSDTFSSLQEADLIEIFNDQHQQIFRNLEFFKHVEVSLFDLSVLDWMSLFKREASIEEHLFICFSALYRRLRQGAPLEDVSEHRVGVRFAGRDVCFSQSPKFCSSLKRRQSSQKKVEAILLVSQSRAAMPLQKVVHD